MFNAIIKSQNRLKIWIKTTEDLQKALEMREVNEMEKQMEIFKRNSIDDEKLVYKKAEKICNSLIRIKAEMFKATATNDIEDLETLTTMFV